MLTDLYSPVECAAYELLADDAGHVRVYLKLFNLSKHPVRRIDAVLTWLDKDTGFSIDTHFGVDDLDFKGRTYFTVNCSTNHLPTADTVSLWVRHVEFTDAPEWYSDEKQKVDIPESEPLSGREHNALRQHAGNDAEQYAVQGNGWWQCVCGRANPEKAARCIRCKRDRDKTLSDCTMQAFLQKAIPPASAELHIDESVHKALVQKARMAEEAPLRRQRGHNIMLWLAAILVLLLGILFYAIIMNSP